LRDIEVGGAALTLLPQKAIWWAEQSTLLVADVHIGKAQSFRKLGVPVPAGTTGDTLERLSWLMQEHAPRCVIFLGDFLHSAHAKNPSTMAAVQAWRGRFADVELLLVRGNHDSRAGDPPPELNIACVDEPFVLPGAPGLLLAHHPQASAQGYVLAGHQHPCAYLGRGFERLRLPCFHFGAQFGVLPAFGAFTGMHPVTRAPGDRVFVVADNAVHPLP
jgi:uncharacterized protein